MKRLWRPAASAVTLKAMNLPLSEPTKDWFLRRYGRPTAVQIGAWKASSAQDHLLAVAPTGSGKTFAAFLTALDGFYSGKIAPGALRVLYISPLKALGTDIKENLTGPLRELRKVHDEKGTKAPEIRIGIRNGDTTPSERRRQIAEPPEILITTPESLNILLLSDGGRRILSTVEICILDEIHAVAPTGRGTLLACALERLADLAGEFQRIGLTATVRPLERAAEFLGGFMPSDSAGSTLIPRPVTIVAPPSEKKILISVEPLPAPPPDADHPDPEGFWKDIARRVRQSVKEHRSTLAFLDSRKWAEKTACLINEGEEEILAWAHHGSLSKDMRRLVETRLKKGELKAVVATGSLELGIDIGPLDEVLMLGSPASPSAALQRAGRAGHRPESPSRARIFPVTPSDLLASAVLSKMSENGEIEALRIPENPLDLLAQVLLTLCAEKGRTAEELWNLIRRSWPFRNLPRKSFDSVLTMIMGRYAETRIATLRPQIYKDGELLVARPGTRMRLYSGGGAIPDLGLFAVKARGIEGTIGSLDEKFVWESRTGMVFHMGNRRWRIVEINDREVQVIPTDEAISTDPFWRAEARDRDEDYSRRVAELLETAEELLAAEGQSEPDVSSSDPLTALLQTDWNLSDKAAFQLADYLENQRRKSGVPLPHRRHIVAESAAAPETGADPEARILFLHTFLGGRVNRPLSLALQAAWEKQSPIPVYPIVTDEVIAFSLTDRDIESFVSLFYGLSDPETLIRRVLEATPFFGGRFREAAGRAMLLPASTPSRRRPLWITRQRSRMLMEAVLPYPDFPILAEAWRCTLNDMFAMDALEDVLEGIRSGDIRISIIRTAAPSPFARNAVRRREAVRMTSNMQDQSDARLISRLDDGEIRRLKKAGILKPNIPENLIRRLDGRRRRLEEGLAPGSVEALKAWIAEREAFDAADWEQTVAAASRDSGLNAADLEKAVKKAVVKTRLGPGKKPWVIAADRAEEWEAAFAERSADAGDFPAAAPAGTQIAEDDRSAVPDGIDAAEKPASPARLDNPETAAALSAFWISGRGPLPVEKILESFGISPNSAAAGEIIRNWEEQENLIFDTVSQDSADEEMCDSEGLEILLRWKRRQNRNADAPLPIDRLPAFLAYHQGFDAAPAGEEHLAKILANLDGLPASAALWETAIFPTRTPFYRPKELDDLVRREEVMWVGAGRNQISFLTSSGGWRFPSPQADEAAEHSLRYDEAFPLPGSARKGFWEIADALELDSAQAVRAIWDRVWSGRLTADDAGVLRRAVASGFKAPSAAGSSNRGGARTPPQGLGPGSIPPLSGSPLSGSAASGSNAGKGGFRGWMAGRPLEGRWYAPAYAEEPSDPMESDQLLRERIRMLLKRYGVISRPLLEREIPPLRWPALAGTLALMELSDEVIGGMWFDGLPMPQFLAPESLPAWRADASPRGGWFLDASDPASPCGLADIASLPPRREGTWIVWNKTGQLDFILSPGRKRLERPHSAARSEDKGTAEALGRTAALLTEREIAPLPRLSIRDWNGKEPDGADLKILEAAGFRPGGSGDWIYRPRPIGMR